MKATVVQPDGKTIIAGGFSSVLGVARNNIARLNADGTLDTGFDPNPGAEVLVVAVQADGKILLGGGFTTLQPNGAVSPTTRNRIARVNADGTLDTAFNPNANNSVNSVGVQADGKILLGGTFTSLQPNGAATPTTRNLFARLNNDPATSTLTIPSAARVQWLRGGTAPESTQVSFDLSLDNGTSWIPLGAGSRISGGWELTGLTLPASGTIRARARTISGFTTSSSGLVEAVASYSLLPDIAVEQPVGTSLADGAGTVDFGTLTLGSSGFVKTFTLRNSGSASLTGLSITTDGANASDFTVSAPGSTTVIPGGTTTFTVTFAPGAAGTRDAALHIASNVTGSKNPFDLTIQGTGIAEITGRWIFYNKSVWDLNDGAANAADDGAIAPDKSALMPGSRSNIANYTSYSRGINGIMVDILGLPGSVSATDFVFKVGNTQSPANWTTAPAPGAPVIRAEAGTGGATRITLIWPDGVIQKQWLEVTVLANVNTGLGAPDVFYFGNAIGETGNSSSDAKVTGADALRVLNNITANATRTSLYDHNRDGKVASADRLVVLNNLSSLQPLVLLDLQGPIALSGSAVGVKTRRTSPARVTWEGDALRLILDTPEKGESVAIWSTENLEATHWKRLDIAPILNPYTGKLEFHIPANQEHPQQFYRLEAYTDR